MYSASSLKDLVPIAEQFAEKNLQAMPVPLTISYNLIQSDLYNLI